MKWSTTLGSLARREAVLLSALASAAALAALGTALGATWLRIVAVVVAAVGALVRLTIAIGRANLEARREQAEADRRLRVRPASINRIDPTRIGVDRAEQTILPGGGQPEYFPRAVDEELTDAVRAAVDGGGPWIVVVRGPAKVGKSRSLFEALRRCDETRNLRLVAPRGAEALKSLLVPGQDLRRDGAGDVLWLDDLEPFLNEGVTLQTLRDWRGDGARAIVAGTLGGKGTELIAGSRRADLATIGKELLQHARQISLDKTSARELAGIPGRLSGDEAVALERHGLAAYVVAGPELERKLDTGCHTVGADPCPEGVALVHAIVDWARCGRTDPIPDDTLRRLWPAYLSPGEPADDDRFDAALTWALMPVAGSIALVQRSASYRAFDYVVRLERDKPEARPVRDECWRVAVADAIDAQALVIGVRAYEAARNEIARSALTRARASSVDEVAAIASYNLGVLLSDLDELDKAIAAYHEVIARFGDSPDRALREPVASALVNKGFALASVDRPNEAIAAYHEVIARFGDSPDPALREQVASALVNRGVALESVGRPNEAIAAYDEVIARFGDSPDPALREQVAKALFNKGGDFRSVDRPSDAIAAYDQVIARFGDSPEPALRQQVAKTLVNKGVDLRRVDRPNEAIAAYDEVIARFGDSPEPALRVPVASALFNKGFALASVNRPNEAIAAYDEVIARFGDSPDPALREQVAKALFYKGFALASVNRPNEAIAAYDEVIARFGDSPDPALREPVVSALFNKGFALASVNRPNEAIAAYDEVIARFGDSPDPALLEQVAKALVNKGVTLASVDRHNESIAAYDEVIARFGDSPEPSMGEILDAARALRGSDGPTGEGR